MTRLFDLCFAFFGLVVLSPVPLLIATTRHASLAAEGLLRPSQ